MEKTEKFSGYWVVAGLLAILFIAMGGMNTWGLFQPNIVAETGWATSQVTLFVTFCAFGSFVATMVVGRVMGKLGPKLTLLVGLIAVPVHMLLLSISSSLVMIYIAALICALAIGWLFAPASVILTNWFIEKRASMIGLVFSGAGFGGAVIVPLTGYFISWFGWRGAYQALAVIMACTIILLLVLVKNSPDSVGQKALGFGKEATVASKASAQEVKGLTAKEALRTPSYWLIFVGIVMTGFLINGLIVFLPTYWPSMGMEPIMVSNLMGIFSLIGGIGVLIAGFIAGKFGTKTFLIYTIAAYIIGIILIMTGAVQVMMSVIALCMIGIAYPLVNTTPSLTTMDAFGKLEYDKILGPFQGAIQIGSGTVAPIVGVIFDTTGSFTPSFIMLIVAAALGLILILAGLIVSPLKKRRQFGDIQR